MDTVNIEGLDKAEVLQALFNGSQQLGMGFLDKSGAVDMTYNDALFFVSSQPNKDDFYIDYLRGRVMKVHFFNNTVSTYLYNRDNGTGKAESIIAKLRQELNK